MAKVKAVKQRITDFLKAKGYDYAEIQDAFAELDAADVDLEKVAELTNNKAQWENWYQQIQPALAEIVNERDTLKQRIFKLEAAGLSFADAQAAATASMQPAMQAQPQGGGQSQFDPSRFQADIVKATNDIVKSASKYGLKHFKDFNEELDYDAVEKLMGERNIPFDVAYDIHTQPRREAREKEQYEQKLKQGIQEGIQAELSKQGIRKTRKRVDDVEVAPLDKPAPSDSDLKAAFLQDLEVAN